MAEVRPRRRGLWRSAAVVSSSAVLALTLAACTPPGQGYSLPHDLEPVPVNPGFSAVEDARAQILDWTGCGNGTSCATALLPLDYEDPSGEVVSIALKRLPATGESIGTIFVNPGGPGESGTELVGSAPYIFSQEVLASYDIVGFDPRGVGSSTQVRCLQPGQEDPTAAFFDITTKAGAAEFKAAYTKLGEMCRELSGDLLDHLDSVHVAKDMDVLRSLMGDEQLNYLGYSYGTMLGATYADLYPERVGRMVLDSAVDPAIDYASLQREQLAAFDDVFAAYVEECQAESECPLPADPDEAAASILDLSFELDEAPLPSEAPDGELLGWEMTMALQGALYYAGDWATLTEGLAQAYDGKDGTVLDELGAGGVMGGSSDPNAVFAFSAIDCVDYPISATFDEAIGHARELAKTSPLFGANMTAEATCALWPAKSTSVRKPITAEGAAPILLIGSLRDPATPYAWTKALSEQLSSGYLITYDGEGHGIYGGISTCVDDAVNDYLLTGALPQEGLVCT